jgi:LPXTG-site transpeptidase (sortase) family protein
MTLILRYNPARMLYMGLGIIGMLLLSYVAVAQFNIWYFNRAIPATVQTASGPALAVYPPGWVGRLEIPRLELAANILEGTDEATLDKAIGHIKGTPLPGQPGNSSLSAHRDTIFRPLRNIKAKDVITVTTPSASITYSVVSTSIVEPTDVSVLKPGKSDSLTLVTCYPFYFVGPAPKRFIVRANRLPAQSEPQL